MYLSECLTRLGMYYITKNLGNEAEDAVRQLPHQLQPDRIS